VTKKTQQFAVHAGGGANNGQEKRSVLIVSVLLPIVIDLSSYGTLVAVSLPLVMLLHDSDIPIGMFHLRLFSAQPITHYYLRLASRSKGI
jgi:hypothetical protein